MTVSTQLHKKHRKDSKGKKKLVGYYLVAYDPKRRPTRKWVSLKTKDKTGAKHRFAKMDLAISRGEFDPWEDKAPVAGVTYADAVAKYLVAREKQAASRRNDKSVLDALGETLPVNLLLSQVKAAHVDGYLKGLTLKPASLQTYVRRIKAFFSWAVQEGLLPTDPVAKLEPPKVGRKEPRYITRKEYAALLKAIDKGASASPDYISNPGWLVDVVRVAVGTGLRLGELRALRWSAVDLEGGSLSVRNEGGFRTKSGHERPVPITPDVRAVLKRLAEGGVTPSDFVLKGARGGPLNPEYTSKRFKLYAERAGLPSDITFHALRRTYASWLATGGVSMAVVQRLLGHQDLTTTARTYAGLGQAAMREGVDRVFGKGAPKKGRPGKVRVGIKARSRRRKA